MNKELIEELIEYFGNCYDPTPIEANGPTEMQQEGAFIGALHDQLAKLNKQAKEIPLPVVNFVNVIPDHDTCECDGYVDDGFLTITLCRIHKVAPKLIEKCKTIKRRILNMKLTEKDSPLLKELQDAIDLAERK